MTSSNFVLTLTLLAVTSCHTLAKPLSADSQQILSLFSSRFLPRLHNPSFSLPSSSSSSGTFSSQEENSDDGLSGSADNNINNNNNNNNNMIGDNENESPFAFPAYPTHSTTREDISDLPLFPFQGGLGLVGNYAPLRNVGPSGLWLAGNTQEGGLTMGRGKRFIPGLNALYMTRLFGNRNDRFIDGRKRKRQPHLGFHASRG